MSIRGKEPIGWTFGRQFAERAEREGRIFSCADGYHDGRTFVSRPVCDGAAQLKAEDCRLGPVLTRFWNAGACEELREADGCEVLAITAREASHG